MKAVLEVLKEQIVNFNLIYRLASYNTISKYQSHYLGAAWQFISPLLQISIYWFVFGLGIRGGHPVGDVPFFIWLLVGLIPWFFISSTVIQGSNSIYTKVSLVSKMKFPVSVLPSITIVGNSFNFIFMLLFLGIILVLYGVNPGIYILQLPYYLFCLYVLIFSVTLLFSTISTIIRDFQMVLQSLMRMMLYFLPILWDTSKLPKFAQDLLSLNPFYYIIVGFRSIFFTQTWFFEDWVYMSYFWVTTLLVLFIGALIHIKFRKQFVDYI
ncbi:ABC transporter permease [Neobacillus sp. PS2-9]|uniref:ABC transporter permease n=1 Tax=Neobacillus sp. PS2-9 TaxID=3070676 RepID=UPI0027E1183E|nr:ABC transporter permease [Neobacillus sp. PS2-9]WML58603.1 ABC transporter permease [Neobacillus sp. PS2-9]